MTHPGVPRPATRAAAAALLAACLTTTAACARRASVAGESGADRDARARTADSARVAAAEASRSSATQVVSFTEEERRRFTRVEHMIRARFTGVQVVPNGRGFSIQIRGSGSFGSSTEPLVVIDGASRTTADLGGLDPREVERIEIVKDGAAAIYGTRGANGVIVIATRRAR